MTNQASYLINNPYRYATTLITSKVSNPENTSREVFMSVILPETAFISRFAIQVDDQVFVAFVKEKEDAWRLYQDAVTKGKTAGKAFESKIEFICLYDKTHLLV